MKKRYQAVAIDREHYKNHWEYIVLVHDRTGKDGLFQYGFYDMSKTAVIKELRAKGIEVSKHVENGGELRLV